jgi:hypothetical protein
MGYSNHTSSPQGSQNNKTEMQAQRTVSLRLAIPGRRLYRTGEQVSTAINYMDTKMLGCSKLTNSTKKKSHKHLQNRYELGWRCIFFTFKYVIMTIRHPVREKAEAIEMDQLSTLVRKQRQVASAIWGALQPFFLH